MAEAEAGAVTETVAGGIVLMMRIRALFPHPHTPTPPKGLDAPLMSPMTSRTGPKGRSETTFVAVAVGRDRDRDRGRGRGRGRDRGRDRDRGRGRGSYRLFYPDCSIVEARHAVPAI